MNAEQMWEIYSTQNNIQAGYEAWAYGDAPDQLAKLTLDGTKTATASAYPLYAQEQEPIPEPGQYSVILDSREEAVCILQTTKVYVTPFSRVSEEQAWKEGGRPKPEVLEGSTPGILHKGTGRGRNVFYRRNGCGL